MADDKIKKVLEKLKGKKAKVKPLKTEPEGTKESKPPKDVVEALEEAHQADFKKARIHTGGNAAELCKELKVKAFVKGPNVFVAKPGDAKNKELIAHELTHAIQQAGGKKLPKEQAGKALVSK